MSIVFRTEYYEPKLGIYVSFCSGTLEDCMTQLGYPIIGDVSQRVAKYEVSGKRKKKYKLLEVIKTLSSNELQEIRKHKLEKVKLGYKLN